MNSTKPRKCSGGCGRSVHPPGHKCPFCKKHSRQMASQRRSANGGHRSSATRVLSYESPALSPVGPISPSAAACAQPEAECRFCGFPKRLCFCSEHDVRIDAMFNRADAETP